MGEPDLLILAPERELIPLNPLFAALELEGLRAVVPQRLTRLGDSRVGTLDLLIGTAGAVLIVNAPGPADPMIERAVLAFRARLATRANRKAVILDRLGAPRSFERHGYAVVLPPGLEASAAATLIRIALESGSDRSTLHAPAVDNLNSPFLSVGAWPLAFLGTPPTAAELTGTSYEEASGLYWSGLNRSGFAGDWQARLAASRVMATAARGAGDPAAVSLILSKGVAFSQIARGRTRAARQTLQAAARSAHAARDPRAMGYALAYRADSWAAENEAGPALQGYDDALTHLRGVERHEVLLRRDLVVGLSAASRAARLARLEALRGEFDAMLNYRAGAIDIALAREAALGGANREAEARLDAAERFFRDQVPMPRNLDRVQAMRRAIVVGTPIPGVRLSW